MSAVPLFSLSIDDAPFIRTPRQDGVSASELDAPSNCLVNRDVATEIALLPADTGTLLLGGSGKMGKIVGRGFTFVAQIVSNEDRRDKLEKIEGVTTHNLREGEERGEGSIGIWAVQDLADTFLADEAIHRDLIPLIENLNNSLDRGEKAFVHCQMGWSRSPAAALALLGYRYGMNQSEAERFLAENSGDEESYVCAPNESMMKAFFDSKNAGAFRFELFGGRTQPEAAAFREGAESRMAF
jgi:hypothetical protein